MLGVSLYPMDGTVKRTAKASRIIVIALGTVLLLLAVAALVLESAWFRGWLEDQASRQLGREVTIQQHTIDWGAPLTLRLDEVQVANADWAEDPMARLDELSVTLNVWELMQGRIALERIDVVQPVLYLLRRDDGTTNIDDLIQGEPTEEREEPLWPQAFNIDAGQLIYRDAAQQVELDVAFDTPGESFEELSANVRGEGVVQGESVAFEGLVHLQIEQRRGAVEGLQGRIGEGQLRGELALDLASDEPYLHARLEADAIDLDSWGLLGEADATGEEESQTKADSEAAEENEAPWDYRLTRGLAWLETFEAELDLDLGQLSYAGQTLHDLAVDLTLEEGRLDIAQLQAHQQLDGEALRALNIQGWLEVEDERLTTNLQAQFDRIDLTAALAPFGVGELGTLDGNLNARVLDGALLFENTALDYQAPHWELALSFTADSVAEGVHLVGDGSYEGESFTYDLQIGSLLDLTDPQAPYRVSGELTTRDTLLWVDGSAVQPFALESVQGSARLEGPTPAELTALTGINLPDLPPYRLAGRIHYQHGQLDVADLEGTFGESNVAGDVSLHFADRPQLVANLVSRHLAADDLLPMLGMSPATGAGEEASPEQQQWEAEEQRAEILFPDREWDLEALRNTDIQLDYTAHDVQAEHVPFESLALVMELEQGVMTVEPLELGLGEGQISASWVMDAGQTALEGDLSLVARQVNLSALLDEAGLPEVARDTLGVVGGQGEFRYRGRSMHEVMAGLDGELELAMSQGWLDIIAAELLPLNVANALVAALTGEGQVQLECTYIRFVANNGLADLDEFFMATEIAHFEGAGAINLATERMELAFQGHNLDPTLFTGNSPVELVGSLREPEVNVLTPELMTRGALSLLGAIVAPPLAILPWIDPGGGEQVGIGCEQALQEFQQ